MDSADLAAKAETEARERILAKHQAKIGVSSLYCRICEDPIGEERRKLIVTDLCIECAAMEEKRNKR